jgi:hypothetical protein
MPRGPVTFRADGDTIVAPNEKSCREASSDVVSMPPFGTGAASLKVRMLRLIRQSSAFRQAIIIAHVPGLPQGCGS